MREKFQFLPLSLLLLCSEMINYVPGPFFFGAGLALDSVNDSLSEAQQNFLNVNLFKTFLVERWRRRREKVTNLNFIVVNRKLNTSFVMCTRRELLFISGIITVPYRLHVHHVKFSWAEKCWGEFNTQFAICWRRFSFH